MNILYISFVYLPWFPQEALVAPSGLPIPLLIPLTITLITRCYNYLLDVYFYKKNVYSQRAGISLGWEKGMDYTIALTERLPHARHYERLDSKKLKNWPKRTKQIQSSIRVWMQSSCSFHYTRLSSIYWELSKCLLNELLFTFRSNERHKVVEATGELKWEAEESFMI